MTTGVHLNRRVTDVVKEVYMEKYNITESEWEVMKVLWSKDKLLLKEIVESMESMGWSYSTIRTLVNRLLKKGVIDADKTESNFKYCAIAMEEDCKSEKVKSMMSKVFDGSLSMMVSTLVNKSNLTKEEYDELMRITEKLGGGDK